MKKRNLFRIVITLILIFSMLLSLALPSFAGRPNVGEESGSGGDFFPQSGSIEISKTSVDGVTPIDGVEFSYVKVADIVQENGKITSLKYKLNDLGRVTFPALADPGNDYLVTGSLLNEYVKNGGANNITYPLQQKGKTVNGKVTFSNLPRGVYVLEETSTKDATINGKKVQITKNISPFLVSVPQTSPDGTKWEKDIKIDAKNIINEEVITKTVEGNDVVKTTGLNGLDVYTAGIGSTMWYTVTGSASKVIEENKYIHYEIEDIISLALSYGAKGDTQAAFLKKIEVYVGDIATANKLVAADYKVIPKEDDIGWGLFVGFNVILTTSGLDKLNAKAMVGDSAVKIKYPANMTDSVLEYAATNTATIRYAHNGGGPAEKSIKLEVHPLGIQIDKLFDNVKVANLPTGNTIDPTKVKFTIEKKGAPNKPIYVKKAYDYNYDQVFAADLSVTKEGNGYTRLFNILNDGSVKVIGLPKGSYVVTEVNTAEGYSLLKDSIEATIDVGKKITTKMVPTEDTVDTMALRSLDISNPDETISNTTCTYNGNTMSPFATPSEAMLDEHEFDKETGILYREIYVNVLGEQLTGGKFKLDIKDPVQIFQPGTFKIERGIIDTSGSKLTLKNPVDVTQSLKDKTIIAYDDDTDEDEVRVQITIDLKNSYNYQYRISYKCATDFGPAGPPIRGSLYDKTHWSAENYGQLSRVTDMIFVYYERIFGTVKVIKVDAENPAKTLPGAIFTVHKSNDHSLVKRVTTNAKGEVLIDQIPYGYYYIKETSAPAGYELDTKEIRFNITEDNFQEVQVIKVANSRDGYVAPDFDDREITDISKLTINNEKSPIFELPSTGGMGTFVYALTGLILLSIAVILYVTLNRNKKQLQ